MAMDDPLAESTARLERLVEQAIGEGDPKKASQITEEIYRVLAERERIRRNLSAKGKRD